MTKEQEFLILLEKHKRLILKVCRFYSAIASNISVEDLFQDIVYNLWKSYPKYEKRPTCKVSTWMYRIALNVAISSTRKQQPSSVPIDEYDDAKIAEMESHTASIEELYALIERLEKDEQALIYLYIDKHTHQEIADIMGITPSNVGTKIQRIKKKMKILHHEQ